MMVSFWGIIGFVFLGFFISMVGAFIRDEIVNERKLKQLEQQQSAPEQETENNDWKRM